MSSEPPAKRQRRTLTTSSCEDSESNPTSSLPLRNGNSAKITSSSKLKPINKSARTQPLRKEKSKNAATVASVKSSPKSSPEKSKKKRSFEADNVKSKSLHSFFNKVAEEERWRRKSKTPDVDSQDTAIIDDDISDDETDEGLSSFSRPLKLTTHGSRRDRVSSKPPSSSQNSNTASVSSQRFKKPRGSLQAPTESKNVPNLPEHHEKPWAERFAPTTLDELAVHKKKIQDVQKWFDDALSKNPHQKVLILKGPAGSGKSALVGLLAQEKKVQLIPWQNPDATEKGTTAGALSLSLQFAEFVSRGGEYGALSFGSEAQTDSEPNNRKRVLLVEEFPTSITRSSEALDVLRSTLMQAAVATNPISSFSASFLGDTSVPTVLVISESLVSSTTAISDSFTAHRLLGPELINHPSVCVIEFNPIAPTFMLKALEIVIKKEARDSGRRRIPGHGVLQKLAEIGDVRNAINSLQFLCTRKDDNADWSGTVASSTKRSTKSVQSLSVMEKDSMKLITSRESTLDMFHAAGKVVYNKREDPRVSDSRAEPPPKPPDHLMYRYTPKISQVDIEALLNEVGTDIQTFVSVLHENYALSCNHDEFTEYLDECASYLSDCDILSPGSRAHIRSKARSTSTQNTYQAGNSETLRQDEISFQVATRGLIFSLPFPVSRAVPHGARKQDAFKMFYPASLRLWKPTEEINGLIEIVAASFAGGSSSYTRQIKEEAGVSAWQNRADTFGMRIDSDSIISDSTRHVDLAKDILVLDYLPYLARIKADAFVDITSINKIVQMRGANIPTDESVEEDFPDEQTSGSFRLTQKVEALHAALQAKQIKQPVERGKIEPSASVTRLKPQDSDPAIERLWIEEDDIEDD